VTGIKYENNKEIHVNAVEFVENNNRLGSFLENDENMCEWGMMTIECQKL
jgi:hypothetical protein